MVMLNKDQVMSRATGNGYQAGSSVTYVCMYKSH